MHGTAEAPAKARKFSALIRQRLAEHGQAPVARACEVDVATVSRWVSEGRLDQFATMLDALRLKVVPNNLRCYPEAEIEALFALAQSRLRHLRHASELAEDDE
jgi:hypothetical protein